MILLIAKYRVASIETPVAGIKVFRMEPLEGSIPKFLPGQWAFIHLLDEKGGSVDKRPYSVASSPSAPYLEFCIELRGGAFTGRLEKVELGMVVGIEGPQGHMTYGNQPKAAFVAGGTGISPVLSMLRHIADAGLGGEFVLFYSVRSADRLLYRDEFERLRKKNPRIKVVLTLTREAPGGWKGECGRISREMIGKHLGGPADFDWWMCGPVEMVKAVRLCLVEMGADPKRVRMEGWG